jgi:hypothetical protein
MTSFEIKKQWTGDGSAVKDSCVPPPSFERVILVECGDATNHRSRLRCLAFKIGGPTPRVL